MIAVIGTPRATGSDRDAGLAGPACLVALAAARAGARVELVGRIGDDAEGDRLVLALGRNGIGHAALLRDPARPTAIESRPPEDDTVDAPVETDDPPAPASPADTSRWPVLEPADVELALRYLPDIRTIVVAEPVPPALLDVAAEVSRYHEATLVVAAHEAADTEPPVPADLLIAAPAADPDGSFAAVLGQVAAAIDDGAAVDEALNTVRQRLGIAGAG